MKKPEPPPHTRPSYLGQAPTSMARPPTWAENQNTPMGAEQSYQSTQGALQARRSREFNEGQRTGITPAQVGPSTAANMNFNMHSQAISSQTEVPYQTEVVQSNTHVAPTIIVEAAPPSMSTRPAQTQQSQSRPLGQWGGALTPRVGV